MPLLFAEWTWPGLVFMPVVSGVVAYVLLFYVIQSVKERSPWSPMALGFLLVFLMIALGSAGQLLGLPIPRGDRLFVAVLLLAAAGMLVTLPLLLLHQQQRPARIRTALWMLAAGAGLLVLSGLVRVADWLIAPATARDNAVTTAIALNTWEQPGLVLCGGLFLTTMAYALARWSGDSLSEALPHATVEDTIEGTRVVRRTLGIVAGAICAALGLYCFAWLGDAAFGTALTSLFQPLIAFGTAVGTTLEAVEFYGEWIAFIVVIGAATFHLISERAWGGLAGLVVLVIVFLGIARRLGALDDWLGPFTMAWRATAALFN
jgi:hypothetical protein